MEISEQQLAEFLKEAKAAHHEHEKTLDGEDENWAQWYAEYINEQVSK